MTEKKKPAKRAPATKRAKHHTHDSETRGMLYEGVSAKQLSEIFRMAPQTVKSMLGTLEPVKKRQGWPIYDLADAASRLATPNEEMLLKFLRRMPANKLPTHLQKEFWDALRSRQLYEENAKDLWRTETVMNFIIDVLRTIRQSLNVVEDAVDRETELTTKQRGIIQGLIDDLLEDVSKKLGQQEIFEHYQNYHLTRKDENDAKGTFELSEILEVDPSEAAALDDDGLGL